MEDAVLSHLLLTCFTFVTDAVHQGGSISISSTFHCFPATLSSSGREWGGGWVGVTGAKPPHQPETAERLITVKTRGKHVLQRGGRDREL